MEDVFRSNSHEPLILNFFSKVLFPEKYCEKTGIQSDLHCVRCHQTFECPAKKTSKCRISHDYDRSKARGVIRGKNIYFQFPCCKRKWKGNWMKELEIEETNSSGESSLFKEEKENAINNAFVFAENEIPYCFIGKHTTDKEKVNYNSRTIKKCTKECLKK